MPTYEYRCKECNRDFSVVLTLSEYEKGPPPGCPYCKSKNVVRIYTSVIVQTSKKS